MTIDSKGSIRDIPADLSSFGMYVVNDCLIVPVNADVDDHDIACLGKEILRQVRTTGIRGVLINVSAIKVMDSAMFTTFRNSAGAAALLGARSVFVGFQPGVASALVDLDIPSDDILTAVTMEDGFMLLRGLMPRATKALELDGADVKRSQPRFSGDPAVVSAGNPELGELPSE